MIRAFCLVFSFDGRIQTAEERLEEWRSKEQERTKRYRAPYYKERGTATRGKSRQDAKPQ